MNRLFPLAPDRTLITALMMAQTPEEFIAEARGAAGDGADAIAFELAALRPEYRNRETFQALIAALPLPFMFVFYRNDRYEPAADDDARQEILCAAAAAGAGMIDVMGDLYDRSEDEYTRDPTAIARQMQAIERIHALGSQVVISSHPRRPLNSDEVVARLQSFAARGADVVKIVTVADTEADYLESLRATMRLRHELSTPFIYLCTGKFGPMQRFAGLSLGVAITFAVHDYHADYPYNQPTVRTFKVLQNHIHWHINPIITA